MQIKNLVYIAIVALLVACGGDKPKPPITDTPPATKVVAPPDFNADSAYAFVAKQVSFGPRVPNNASHTKCANYLIEKLKSYADTVIVQRGPVTTADGRNLTAINIIARFDATNTNRIMLCAHWDTRHIADQDDERQTQPILGANDGGSGVGVLLEIGRILKDKKPGVGVDIILFDAEDQGDPEVENSYCLGTQYWAKNNPIPFYQPLYGILLDMVGGKNAQFYKEGVSMQYASYVVDKVWGKANELGYGAYFVNNTRSGITDDHYYVNTLANIKCIDIIQYGVDTGTGFASYWHTHDDNMDAVDKNTLKAVGQTLLGVVYNENPVQ